jgi:hypothetical protein
MRNTAKRRGWFNDSSNVPAAQLSVSQCIFPPSLYLVSAVDSKPVSPKVHCQVKALIYLIN